MMSQMQLPFFRGRFRRPRVTCTDKIVGQLTLSSEGGTSIGLIASRDMVYICH